MADLKELHRPTSSVVERSEYIVFFSISLNVDYFSLCRLDSFCDWVPVISNGWTEMSRPDEAGWAHTSLYLYLYIYIYIYTHTDTHIDTHSVYLYK